MSRNPIKPELLNNFQKFYFFFSTEMFMKPDKFKKKKKITWICWTLWASEAKYLLLLFTEPAVSVTFHYKAHPVIYLFIFMPPLQRQPCKRL